MPVHVLGTLHILAHLLFIATFWSRDYYPHFTDKEIEVAPTGVKGTTGQPAVRKGSQDSPLGSLVAKSISLTALLPLSRDPIVSGKTILKFVKWITVCTSVMEENNLLVNARWPCGTVKPENTNWVQVPGAGTNL